MKTIMTGAQAACDAMKQINPDFVSAFPITPQTEIMMEFSKEVANKTVDTEFVLVESEHSAISAVVGASAAGARSMTATSSAGLALMYEILGIASGLRLPIIMNVVNRALSGPINIHCDHSDSMGCKDTGWIQIYNENAQEVYDNTIIATKLSEKLRIPTMVMQDGFITSHAVQNIELLEDKQVKNFVKEYNPKHSLLNFDNPITVGPLQLTDYYFETKKQESDIIKTAITEYEKLSKEYKIISKKDYKIIEEYKVKDADYVIVALNSICGAIKDVVDDLRSKGEKVGLLKIRMFRPFPYDKVKQALSCCKKVTVMDRSESFGANPPLMSEVMNSVNNCEIRSVIFGLGGREIMESDILKIFNNMINGKKQEQHVGVRL